MDADISRWILEFLMRSTAVPDHVIKKLLQVLPLSAAAKDTRFKKAVLLRTIQSEISDATVTETTLQALELIEEMDRNDGVEIGESLKAAYFAAAVECTVKYLALEGSNGKYFEAVKRVWRGRIGTLEKSGTKSELVRDNAELTRWKNDLEAALGDAKAAKRLMNLNTRAEALQKLRAFLGEAWALMGPSFIEAAADKCNGAGEFAAEQEAAAQIPELAVNEEDKLAAGKGAGVDSEVSESVSVYSRRNTANKRKGKGKVTAEPLSCPPAVKIGNARNKINKDGEKSLSKAYTAPPKKEKKELTEQVEEKQKAVKNIKERRDEVEAGVLASTKALSSLCQNNVGGDR